MTDAPVYYKFHPMTGELIGSGVCRTMPDGSVITYPATHRGRTHTPPPAPVDGFVPCFIDGAWQQVEDHRNLTVYAASTGAPLVIRDLGPIPDGYANTPPVIAGPTLADIKARLRAQIEDDAETCRLHYITPGAGMAMTYREKFEQAKAVDDLGQTAANALTTEQYAAQYPTLAASVGLEAGTLWDCAQLVIERYEQFTALSGAIERSRMAAKMAIAGASDADAAQAAYEAVTWPNP